MKINLNHICACKPGTHSVYRTSWTHWNFFYSYTECP